MKSKWVVILLGCIFIFVLLIGTPGSAQLSSPQPSDISNFSQTYNQGGTTSQGLDDYIMDDMSALLDHAGIPQRNLNSFKYINKSTSILAGDGYQWHTFYGSAQADIQEGNMVVDNMGGIYIAGFSNDTWNGPSGQPPLNAYNGAVDIVVLKLDNAGNYLWHTFFGSSISEDIPEALALDSNGGLFVVGGSTNPWDGPGGQAPLNPYTWFYENVIIKLDTNGSYQWHTFYGGNDWDSSMGIAVDDTGELYITGMSFSSWNGPAGQPPLHDFAGGRDIAVIKLNQAGYYQWHTFFGSYAEDYGNYIGLDDNGDVYISADSNSSWEGPSGEPPKHAHSEGGYGDEARDLAVLKLDGSGAYQWHTFYGSASEERNYGMEVTSTDIYLASLSRATWDGPSGEIPLNAHGGGIDINVLKLDTNGNYLWHTFYGSALDDWGVALALDGAGSMYVTGFSGASWNGPAGESPINAYAGGDDITIIKLDLSGAYQWHAFYGSSSIDQGWWIALGANGNVYVSGHSTASWNGPAGQEPLNAFTGDYDYVVLKLHPGGLNSISGKVSDASGDPMGGVTVSTDTGVSAMTDNQGNYIISDLITGTYTLTPSFYDFTFSPITRTVSVPPDATGVNFTSDQNVMLAVITTPSLGKSWQGYSLYYDEYTTLFVGNNGIGDWPHCSGSIDRIEVRSLSGGPTIIEDFDDPNVFSQVGSTVYISNGKAVFDNFYMSGGPAFVYRSIPTFSGPVEIKVIGQVDWAENNCGVFAGIADDNLTDPAQYTSDYPGIAYTYFGGGCLTQGPVVFPSGTTAADAYTGDGCSFTPDGAPWFGFNTPFEAELTLAEMTPYSISGHVTAVNGDPLSDVLVSTDYGLSVMTDDSGNYEISNVITGTSIVIPSLPGYTFVPPSRTVNVPPDASGVDFIGLRLSGEKIFFTSNRAGDDYEIYAMDPDGSNVSQLTFHPNMEGHDHGAVLSPDKSKIVFLYGIGDFQEIRVMDAQSEDIDNTNSRLLFSSDRVAYPRWSPDGSKIVFSSGGQENEDVYIMNSDGTGVVPLTDWCGADGSPDISPYGSTIVWASGGGSCEYHANALTIYLMNVDGSNKRQLLNNGNAVKSAHVRWSPDGTKILISHLADDGNSWSIYTINSDGTDLQLILDNANTGAWSPDGRMLVLNRPIDGNTQNILIMNSDGTGVPIVIDDFPSVDNATDWQIISLPGTYTIYGHVADSLNDPISGVMISTNTGASAYTNAIGTYAITNLITDTYTVTPSLVGYTFTPPSRTVSVPPDATGVDFIGTGSEMVATLSTPSLGKSWQGKALYTGDYTTLFVGLNGIGDWPHCSGSIERIEVRSLNGGPIIVEDFNDPNLFTQVGATVHVSGGKAVFDNIYMDGGPQFIYRSIPAFNGPVEIKVIGQVDWWENNCFVTAGIADDNVTDPAQYTSDYPGIIYSFFGGGCGVQGPLVWGSGTTVNEAYTSDGCSFTGDGAPWFAANSPFEADLTISGGSLYSISGQVTDTGGNPLPDVLVSTDNGGSAITDAGGNYIIPNLTTRTYTIMPTKAGYAFSPNYRTVPVPPDQNNINFTGTFQDNIPPSVINLKAADGTNPYEVDLSWTAPGDDGNVGTASQYDLRYSAAPINSSNWTSAKQVDGEPAPEPAGTAQGMTLTMQYPGQTYYFAIKTVDDSNNWSIVSNSPSAVSGVLPDTIPPARITDLQASAGPNVGEVLLTWTAPGDDGNVGTAHHYVARWCSYVDNGYPDRCYLNGHNLAGEPAPLPAGTPQSMIATDDIFQPGAHPYFVIKALDEAGNKPGASNVANFIIPSQPTDYPDLQTTINSVNPTTLNPGDSITINFTVENIGAATSEATNARISFAIYPNQSNPPRLCSKDESIPSLAPGGSVAFGCVGTIPSDIDGGTYYVVVMADTANFVVESNENNNHASQAITINLPPTPPPHDLLVRGIEVTQGIQFYHIKSEGGLLTEQNDHDTKYGYGTSFPDPRYWFIGPGRNEIRLIEGRTTIVRVYIDIDPYYDQEQEIPVRLYYHLDSGIEYPLPIKTITLSGKEDDPRSTRFKSFNFVIDGSLLIGDVLHLRAEVNPENTIPGDDLSNNIRDLPPITLYDQNPLSILFVPVKIHNPGANPETSSLGSFQNVLNYLDFLDGILPMNGFITETYKTDFLYQPSKSNYCDVSGRATGELLDKLENLKSSFPNVDVIVGVISTDAWKTCHAFRDQYQDQPILGMSHGWGDGNHSIWAIDNPVFNFGDHSYYDTLAHELSHLYLGLFDLIDGVSNPNWPYEVNYNILEEGIAIRDFNFNSDKIMIHQGELSSEMTTYPIKDIMSYDFYKWSSPYTWEYWMNYRPLLNHQMSYNEDINLIISGVINKNDQASIDPLFESNGVVFTPPVGTEYCVQSLSASNNLISEQCFDLGFYDKDNRVPVDTELFQVSLLKDPLIAKIRLTHNTVPIAEVVASTNSPVVNLTYPNGGELLDKPFTVSWSASDEDGDALAYKVLYSADNGVTWSMLSSAITNNFLEVDPNNLPGTQNGLFKIIASDGFNNGEDQSDGSFYVTSKPPEAYITLPVDGSTAVVSTSVTLQGAAYDIDAGIPDGNYSWSSDLEGELGTGKEISVTLLTPGVHKITLTVTDSDGMSVSQTIFLEVLADTDQDGMPDQWEYNMGLDPLINDAQGDPDGEGLTNLEEYRYGTDPLSYDTDLDGFDDLTEIYRGTDPREYTPMPHMYLPLISR